MALGIVEAMFATHSEARRLALEDAIKAVEGERVDASHSDDVHSDEAYNRALDYAIEAIRALST